jgi:hypothetical protein
MRIVHAAPIAASSAPSAHRASRAQDPIEWFFFEERGPEWGGRWSQLTVELWAAEDGRGTVTDGRMTYPHDPGTVEDRYYSIPDFLRDGADPDRAAADASRGAALLLDAIERGAAESAQYLVPKGSRVPRNPDELDIWIRRDSGASERYLVPVDRLPQGLRDARAHAAAFAATVRRDFIAFPGGELEPTATA